MCSAILYVAYIPILALAITGSSSFRNHVTDTTQGRTSRFACADSLRGNVTIRGAVKIYAALFGLPNLEAASAG